MEYVVCGHGKWAFNLYKAPKQGGAIRDFTAF